MNWIREHYHKYMYNAVVARTVAVTLTALTVVLIWYRFIDSNENLGISRGLPFGLVTVGIICILISWFQYLRLDGLTPFKDSFSFLRKPKKEKKKHFDGDIVDYTDEDIVSFKDLEEEDKIACSLAADIITGVLLILAGAIASIFM